MDSDQSEPYQEEELEDPSEEAPLEDEAPQDAASTQMYAQLSTIATDATTSMGQAI